MTLQDFLVKVHDRNVDKAHLLRSFKDLMRPSYSLPNLNESDQEFILDLIMKTS